MKKCNQMMFWPLNNRCNILIFIVICFKICSLSCLNTYKPLSFTSIEPTDSLIQYIGRFNFSDPTKPSMSWPGSMVCFRCTGSWFGISLQHKAYIENNEKYGSSYYSVFIDSLAPQVIALRRDSVFYFTVPATMDSIHTVRVFKRTEAFCGTDAFLGIYLEKGKTLLMPPKRLQRRIEFIGNSITCGYGNEIVDSLKVFSSATENSYASYASITARACNAECMLTSYSGKGMYQNSEPHKDTLPMPKIFSRINPHDPLLPWNFAQWIPHAVVINLGINDFNSTSVPNQKDFVAAYLGFIKAIRGVYPSSHIFLINGSMSGNFISDPSTPGTKILAIELLQTYIAKTLSQAKLAGITSIDTLSLSLIKNDEDVAIAQHPSIKKHYENAAELTAFVTMKMKWY